MVNKVILIGRLGKDPVVKHFQNDSAIAEFSLATTESYRDKEGKWNDITDWHNIKLPNKYMAERAEKYLKKGSSIYVEGKIRTRSYDDKDGNKRYVTEIIAETFRMLDKRGDGGSDSNSGGGYSSSNSSSGMSESSSQSNSQIDDDLPF
ncbi:MAG: single-stranded DNA-binding protein [Chitinophagales bacterium]